jgi:DHA1 family inner membrane transport protein
VDRTLIVTLAAGRPAGRLRGSSCPSRRPARSLIFLWGVASFALVPPLQVRVMTAAADAPNLASAVNIGAFNLGNAIGAALGGAVIAGGLPSTPGKTSRTPRASADGCGPRMRRP